MNEFYPHPIHTGGHLAPQANEYSTQLRKGSRNYKKGQNNKEHATDRPGTQIFCPLNMTFDAANKLK